MESRACSAQICSSFHDATGTNFAVHSNYMKVLKLSPKKDGIKGLVISFDRQRA
jgi:hypothetical protein